MPVTTGEGPIYPNLKVTKPSQGRPECCQSPVFPHAGGRGLRPQADPACSQEALAGSCWEITTSRRLTSLQPPTLGSEAQGTLGTHQLLPQPELLVATKQEPGGSPAWALGAEMCHPGRMAPQDQEAARTLASSTDPAPPRGALLCGDPASPAAQGIPAG